MVKLDSLEVANGKYRQLREVTAGRQQQQQQQQQQEEEGGEEDQRIRLDSRYVVFALNCLPSTVCPQLFALLN